MVWIPCLVVVLYGVIGTICFGYFMFANGTLKNDPEASFVAGLIWPFTLLILLGAKIAKWNS